MTEYHPIDSAPRTGVPVKITGLRYITEEPYEAIAIWTTRRCPECPCEGWFPPSDQHDGMGPYEDVTGWAPLENQHV